MRLLAALRNDILFQFRHGFYTVYLIISVIYIFMLRSMPENIKETATVLILFTDTGVLGFFFIGGIILLEKAQNTLDSLFVTPLRLSEYLLSKIISLTLIALITSGIITQLGFGHIPNPLIFILGIFFTSFFFTCLGLVIAARAKNLNGYFSLAMLCTLIVVFPISHYLNLFSNPLFFVLPTTASLILLDGGFNHLTFLPFIYTLTILGAGSWLLFLWARSWFTKYVILKIGEKT